MRQVLKIVGITACLLLTTSPDPIISQMDKMGYEQVGRWLALLAFVAGLVGIVILLLPKKPKKLKQPEMSEHPEPAFICHGCGWKGSTLLDHLELLEKGICLTRPSLNPKYKGKKEQQ